MPRHGNKPACTDTCRFARARCESRYNRLSSYMLTSPWDVRFYPKSGTAPSAAGYGGRLPKNCRDAAATFAVTSHLKDVLPGEKHHHDCDHSHKCHLSCGTL